MSQIEQGPQYLLFKSRPVYEYNGRYYQVNIHGVVFDISAIQPDPHFPGYMDMTDAICNPTYEITRAVHKLAGWDPYEGRYKSYETCT